MNIPTWVSILSLVAAATGFSLVFKDYLASLLGGVIIRRLGHVRPGVRVRLMIGANFVIKGDVVSVGALRTTLHEVGDGEHLPSIDTGRVVKIPNFTLINSPLVIYGETIVDEVVASERCGESDAGRLEADMRAAIEDTGHSVFHVGLYQRDGQLVVHGMYRVAVSETSDARTEILKAFLGRRRPSASAPAGAPA